MKVPDIDLALCSVCGGCLDLCPLVFSLNAAGYVEVADLPEYPEAEVDEAIKNCPAACISWRPA